MSILPTWLTLHLQCPVAPITKTVHVAVHIWAPSAARKLVPSVTICSRVCYRHNTMVNPTKCDSFLLRQPSSATPEGFVLFRVPFVSPSRTWKTTGKWKTPTQQTEKLPSHHCRYLKLETHKKAMPPDSLHQSHWETGVSCWCDL